MKKIILFGTIAFLILLGAVHAETTTLEITKEQWSTDENFYFPAIVKAGQNFAVNAEINNTGTADAVNVDVVLDTTNNSWITSSSNNHADSLASGTLLSPSFTMNIPSTGIYDINITVSADNAQENFTKSRTIEVVAGNALIVKAGKSLQTLQITAPSSASAYANNEFGIDVLVKNTGNRTINSVEFSIDGIDISYIVSNAGIANIAKGETKTGTVRVKIPSTGVYNILLRGTAWYDVSVSEGSTSYKAFTQIANINATWIGFPYYSYWLNSIDSLGSGLTWSYIRNGSASWCGMGTTGGAGCLQGDYAKNSDTLEWRYYTSWNDWTQPPQTAPFANITTTISNLLPLADTGGSGGGSGGGVSAAPVKTPEKVEEEKQPVAETTQPQTSSLHPQVSGNITSTAPTGFLTMNTLKFSGVITAVIGILAVVYLFIRKPWV